MSLWTSTKSAWNTFETKVYSLMPGFKTHIVTGLGAVGSTAAALQEYITGLPLNQLMDGTQIALVTAILFTLAFWFHNMGNRVSVGTPSSNL